MKNADKTAMPNRSQSPDNVFGGLTKREMFAMHAPSEIPGWFSNNFNADISNIEKPEFSAHQKEMMNEYQSDNYNISDEDFKIGSEASSADCEYRYRCDIERERQMYFAWKLYHADALLKELEKLN